PYLHSFPTRRSSDLTFRDRAVDLVTGAARLRAADKARKPRAREDEREGVPSRDERVAGGKRRPCGEDPRVVFVVHIERPGGHPRSEEHTSELQSPYD